MPKTPRLRSSEKLLPLASLLMSWQGMWEEISMFTRILRSLSLPVFAALLVPGVLLFGFGVGATSASGNELVALRWLGAAGLIVAGLWLMVTTILLFASHGRGTLAPWDPPKRLVVRGPYRYVRNPMLTGVNAILLGEAVALWSLPILVWALAFIALNTLYFVASEEPGLRRRFGGDYELYCRHVRRWWPRLRPWDLPEQERSRSSS